MSQRKTSFTKKSVPVKPQPERFLYYAVDSDVCRELLKILTRVPDLAKTIACVDVDRFDVNGINYIPAIDDGVSDTPHEMGNAFLWVLDRCYGLLNDLQKRPTRDLDKRGIVKLKDDISQIEFTIRQLFRKHRPTEQEITPGSMMRDSETHKVAHENTTEFKAVPDDQRSLARYDTVPDETVKEKYQRLVKQGKPKAVGSIEERIKREEQERERMMEEAKQRWMKLGVYKPGQEPSSNGKRERKARSVSLSERDLSAFQESRQRMIEDLQRNLGGKAPQQREPRKHQRTSLVGTV